MNDLRVFSNSEFGELGVMTIDGKEYFPATQCAKILGYAKPADAIRVHCKGVFKMETPTAGGTQKVNYISEGDLYRLIISSKLPAAEKFERWVFDEVLPSIRKTGGYGTADIEQIISKTAAAAVTEVIKQLIPALSASGGSVMALDDESIPAPKAKKRRSRCTIELLSEDIRDTVDEMLMTGMSYYDVRKYLLQNGVVISQAAICRYYGKFFK